VPEENQLEKFVGRNCKSKDRQYDDQMKKDKRTGVLVLQLHCKCSCIVGDRSFSAAAAL
jgi:hypothetical protein